MTRKGVTVLPNTLTRTRARFKKTPGLPWVRRFVNKVQQDDVLGMAAEIAYHWIFAIPPLLILIVMAGAFLDRVANVEVVEQLRAQISDRAPADTASVLNRLVDNAVAEVGGGTASVGVLAAAFIAIWAGSNAMGALMKAFNRAYDVEESRSYLRKRLVAVVLTLLLVTILNGAFVLLVYGRRVGEWVAGEIGAGSLFNAVWGVIQWPWAILGTILVLGLLYAAGPNLKQPFRRVTPGSIIATALWLILVLGFGIYLRFSNPGSAYGVLGGVIVLMFFLYLTAAVLLIGAEINATIGEEESEKTGRRRRGRDA